LQTVVAVAESYACGDSSDAVAAAVEIVLSAFVVTAIVAEAAIVAASSENTVAAVDSKDGCRGLVIGG